jgi:hypothetical protein
MLQQLNNDENVIALELARNHLGMGLSVPELIAKLNITEETLKLLLKNENFKQMVRAYRAELERDHEGVRLKSAIALEDSIPRLHRLIHDPETPANVVVQGCKQLGDMAGINKQQTDVKTAGSGFVVNIDLSGLSNIDTKKLPTDKIDTSAEEAKPDKFVTYEAEKEK